MRALYLTMDTDWCHEEILRYALQLFVARHLPCTVFVTGAYASLAQLDIGCEIGLHPDFNHATIAQYESKIRELHELYPQALGIASHAMTSSTPLLNLFTQFGFKYDRNLLCYKIPGVQPFLHYNGLLRLPLFWEDDIWFSREPGARFTEDLLEHNSFHLIFNFHPIHLFMNTASAEHYQAFKPYQHDLVHLADLRRPDYGALSFFEDLTAYVQKQNLATGLLKDFLRI